MNRTAAISLSVASAVLCGCPGLVLIVIAAAAAYGSQVPEIMAQNTGTPQDALLGAGMFLCVGGLLILIPIVVGVISFRFVKPEEINSAYEYIPPAS